MTLTLDASQDYLLWDNTESVTYRTKLSGAGLFLDKPLTNALGRAPNWKEQQASNGVYTSQDRVWNIPAKVVTDAALPTLKPGDKIKDAASAEWTVLQVTLNTWKTAWRLMCRNLNLAYGLRDTVTIQRAAVTRDASGSHVTTWHDYLADIPARVQPTQYAPMDMLGVTGVKGDYLVVVDREVELTATTRVRFGTKYLEVNSVRNPQRIDELPILDCQSTP